MDSNSTMVGLLEVVFHYSQEVFNYIVWRSRAINEEQIIMTDSSICEVIFIIFFLIQSDYFVNTNIFENFNVFIWVLAISVSGISVFDWTHESNKFAWDDPVEISIFNSLVVFVLFDVEASEIVPAKFNSVFEPLQYMQKCAIIEAITFACISVMLE